MSLFGQWILSEPFGAPLASRFRVARSTYPALGGGVPNWVRYRPHALIHSHGADEAAEPITRKGLWFEKFVVILCSIDNNIVTVKSYASRETGFVLALPRMRRERLREE